MSDHFEKAEDLASRRSYEHLAELIATNQTDEALRLLHEIAPDLAPSPAVTKHLIAARAAEQPRRAS